MHHVYHTEAFVLASKNVGEANRSFTLFTRELGVVQAVAQGVRFSKSKLRFTLQDFSFIQVDLVRGKEVWRITSAVQGIALGEFAEDAQSLKMVAKISTLVSRLMKGEGEHVALYEYIKQSFLSLAVTQFSKEMIESMEIVTVLEILFHLGYMDKDAYTDQFIGNPLSGELLEKAQERRKELVLLINNSLRETQLL